MCKSSVQFLSRVRRRWTDLKAHGVACGEGPLSYGRGTPVAVSAGSWAVPRQRGGPGPDSTRVITIHVASRPAARPRLEPACPTVCTRHVLHVAWQFPLDHGLFLESAEALVRTARGSADGLGGDGFLEKRNGSRTCLVQTFRRAGTYLGCGGLI